MDQMGYLLRRGVALAVIAMVMPACGGGGEGRADVTPPPSTSNHPPGVRLAAPSPNTSFAAGSDIPLEARITDDDGFVTRVDFFEGATLLGTDFAWPFEMTWTSVPGGTYSLVAVATDDASASTTSAPVAITVSGAGGGPPANRPPTVSMVSPASATSVEDGFSMMLEAQATDAEGPVARVEFFDAVSSLGSATSAPFRVAWTATPVGSHSIQAVATDGAGASTRSNAVAVTVTATRSPRRTSFLSTVREIGPRALAMVPIGFQKDAARPEVGRVAVKSTAPRTPATTA